MEKNVSRTFQSFAAARDKFFPALTEYLDCDIRRNASLVNETAAKVEFNLGSGRKSDLDLFKADLSQQVKKSEFFLDVHRLGKGLIAVAEVDATPDWGSLDDSIGPFSVRQKYRLKRTIFRTGRRMHK